MTHVLVVDDEPQIRHLLRAYLTHEGYQVSEAATGAETERLTQGAGTPPVDAILLDVGLPDVDGLEVLRRLRATSDVPVLLVTARAEEVDTLVGLAVGADDYITKPFSPREVVARLKAVLRRTTHTAPHHPRPGDHPRTGPANGASAAPHRLATDDALIFPGLVIDPVRREVIRHDRPIDLSALEFDILLALATSPGRVFSRAQLLDQVWGYDFYGDERVVDVHIRNIRRRLGDDAAAPTCIGTVRGVGYKFLPAPAGAP